MERVKISEGSVIILFIYLFIYNYEIVFQANLFIDRFYNVTNKKEHHC